MKTSCPIHQARWLGVFCAAVWLFEIPTQAAQEIEVRSPTDSLMSNGSTHSFGTFGLGFDSGVKTYAIKNTGDAALNVSSISLTGGSVGDFTLAAGTMPAAIQPGGLINFTLKFGPSATGTRTTTLRILNDDNNEATTSIKLSGTGVAPLPEIAIEHPVNSEKKSGATIDLGNRKTGGSSAPMSITINNSGYGTLNVGSVSVQGGNSSEFAVSTAGMTANVPPGGDTTFRITFSPAATGVRSTTLRVLSNDADEATYSITLTGTGTTSALDDSHLVGPSSLISDLNGVVFANSLFVAVGYFGVVVTSTDGQTWTQRSTGVTKTLWDVAYGNGVFIVVGEGGTALTSSDGITWTDRSASLGEASGVTFHGIAFGNDVFAAVGGDASSGSGMGVWTKDGIVWNSFPAQPFTSSSGSTSGWFWDVTYGNGRFAFAGDGGVVGHATFSMAGMSAISSFLATPSFGLNAISYANGTFITIGTPSTDNTSVSLSSDAIFWSNTRLAGTNVFPPLVGGVTHGNHLWLATARDVIYDGLLISSVDGKAWDRHHPGVQLNGVAFGQSTFVGVGNGGAIVKITLPSSQLTITTQPVGNTAAEGGGASFSIAASGSGMLRYQWRKDGRDLEDVFASNVSGSQTSVLTLSGISLDDFGLYSVLVTDDTGSVESIKAPLVVTSVPGGFTDNSARGGGSGTLRIESGDQSFASVTSTNKTLIVPTGTVLVGGLNLRVSNTADAGATVPLVYTPSWGDPATSWRSINNTIPAGASTQQAAISLTVPTVPGTYHVMCSFLQALSGNYICSATSVARSPVWNDGNDLARLSPAQIAQAQASGVTVNSYLFSSGTVRSGYAPLYFPCDVLTIIATDTAQPTPAANTGLAEAITLTTATIAGAVNANGASCSLSFDYGTDTSYGQTIAALPASATGTTGSGVSATLSGLSAGTVYHYRLKAQHSGGTVYGEDAVFTTAGNADLLGLTVSAGNLSPGFAPAFTAYTASVTNSTTSITVTPVAANLAAGITVNGQLVNSGATSAPIALGAGVNSPINVVVTPAGGGSARTYQLVITRAGGSTDATLSGLSLSASSLSPFFVAGTLSYIARVSYSTTSVSVTPTVTEPHATIRVNGQPVVSGSSSAAVPLFEGSNNILKVIVTAQDGVATKTYRVAITRTAPTGAAWLAGWGSERDGQLGNGVSGQNLAGYSRFSTSPVPVDQTGVLAGKTITSVSAGYAHTVALCSDGTLAAWGNNSSGQLGNNSKIDSALPVAVDMTGVLAGKTVTAVSAGAASCLCLCSDGTLVTWGNNYSGELGNNAAVTNSPVPVLVNQTGVLAGKTVVAISSGYSFHLVLCSDGTMASWGYNTQGQLGWIANSDLPQRLPVAVYQGGAMAGKLAVAIAAGLDHCLALCSDGTVAAWGRGSSGQLGPGAYGMSGVPVLVDTQLPSALAGKTVIAIAAGNAHSHALCSDGTLTSWGSDADGLIGDADHYSYGNTASPVRVWMSGAMSGKMPATLTCNSGAVYVRCTDGSIYTWGSNSGGLLGTGGTPANSNEPISFGTGFLHPGEQVIALATGGAASHAFALLSATPSGSHTITTSSSPAAGGIASGGGTFAYGAIATVVATPNAGYNFINWTVNGVEVGTSQSYSFNARASIQLVAHFVIPGPEISVEQPAGTGLTDGSSTVSFGSLVVGTLSVPLTFTITNDGTENLALGTISMTGAHMVDFTVDTTGIDTSVGPGSSTTFQVTGKPGAAGLRTAVIHIASNDANETAFDITLTINGLTPTPPVPTTLAATEVTTSSARLNGKVNASGSMRDVFFDFGTTTSYGSILTAMPSTVTGSASTPVSAVLTGLLPHTSYHFRVRATGPLGSANGADLVLTTLNTPPTAVPDSVIALPGAAITIPVAANDTDADGDAVALTALKTVPPTSAGAAKVSTGQIVFTPSAAFTGTSFTYSISDGHGGSSTGTVSVGLASCDLSPTSSRQPASAVSYPIAITASAPWTVSESLSWLSVSPASGTGNGNVTVSLLANTSKTSRSGVITIGGRAHTITQAGTLGFTIDQPAIVPTGMVSANYSLTIPALTSPVKFTMSGHPSGLAINASTGAITGKPKASGTFKLSITGTALTGSSIAGAVTTLTVPITIQALPLGAVGTFHGPIAREADLSLGLGGRFEVTTTSTGTLTGKVVLGATSYTFPTTAVIDSTVGSASPTVAFNIPRKLPASPLAVSFTLDSANHAITGGDINDGTHHATFTAWRKKWGTTLTQPEKDDLNRYLGFHTFALKAPAGQPALPQGAGYGTFTVAATTGAITTAGKLADNTAFTSSSFCGPNGEVLMYQALYSNKGSILGTLDITQGSAGFVPPYGDNTLAGIVSWLRPAISGRLYPTGFGPYDLTAVGGRYVAPSPSTAIVMGIVDNLTSNNATLTFSGADILSSPDIAFRLAAKSVFVKPAAASNPSGTTLTITPSTGYITGSFKLTDANAIVTTAVRPATYYGQIVRDSDQVMRGYGFFLLADSPAAAGQTVNTTLQKSGIVVLQKDP